MQLEEIKISISAETQQAVTALSSLASALKSLDKLSKNGVDFSPVNQAISKFASGIDKVATSTIEKITKIADAFGKLNSVKIDPSVGKALEDIGNQTSAAGSAKASGLAEAGEQATSSVSSVGAEVEEVESKLSALVRKAGLLREEYAGAMEAGNEKKSARLAIEIANTEKQIIKEMQLQKNIISVTDAQNKQADAFSKTGTQVDAVAQSLEGATAKADAFEQRFAEIAAKHNNWQPVYKDEEPVQGGGQSLEGSESQTYLQAAQAVQTETQALEQNTGAVQRNAEAVAAVHQQYIDNPWFENMSAIELQQQKLDIIRGKYYEVANAENINYEKLAQLSQQYQSASAKLAKLIAAENQEASASKRSASATEKNAKAKETATKSTHKYTGALGKLAATFKRIVLYRAIRSMIMGFTKALKEGITNLYQYSKALGSADGTGFAKTMDTYASMALKLKNSLATALAPVIQAIMPMLQKLAGYAIQAANALAHFFAVLNGQSEYYVAKDVAVEWGDAAADSIGGANDAAEELKRTLLGFDEINALDAPNSGGSGGGGGGGGSSVNASDMFEKRKTEQLTGIWAKLAGWITTIKKDVETIWGWVKKIFDKLADAGVFDIIIEIIDDIVTTIDGIIQELDNSGVIDAIAEALADILGAVKEIWDSEIVQSIISSVLVHAVQVTADATESIADALQAVADLLNGDGEGALQHFVDSILGAIKMIIKAAFGVWDVIVGIVNGIFSMIMNGIASLADRFPTVAKILGTTGDDIRADAQKLMDDVNDFFDGAENTATESISRVQLAWNMLWEDGSDTAEKFMSATSGMTEKEMDRLYELYTEGKAKIEDDVIKIDADGDGYYEEVLEIKSEYEETAKDISSAPIKLNGDDSDAANKIKQIGGQFTQIGRDIANNPIKLNANGTPAISEMQSVQRTWSDLWLERKDLYVEPGSAYDAVNDFKDYWANLDLTKKMEVSLDLKDTNGQHIPLSGGRLAYAEGGLVDSGQVFIAREAGPELVGTMGRQTAVANNDQIVEGIASGVAAAMASQNSLLSQQNGLLREILAKSGNVTISTSAIIDGLSRTNRRAGKPIVQMG